MRQSRISRMPWLGQAAITSISPIGFVNGEPVYPIAGADGEGGSGGGEGGTGSGSGEGGSGSGGTGDDGGKGGDDEEPPKDPEQYKAWVKIRDLSRENANRRVRNKELDDALKKANDELEALRAKDMSDLEKANTALAKAEKTTQEQAAALEGLRIENAFLKLPRDKYNWHDPAAALTLLMAEHRGELTLNDDGTVDGMDSAVKALAKSHKFLLNTAVTTGGGEGGDKGGSTGGSYGNNGDRGTPDARKAFQDRAVARFELGH